MLLCSRATRTIVERDCSEEHEERRLVSNCPIIGTQVLVELHDTLAVALLAAPDSDYAVIVQINRALGDDVCKKHNGDGPEHE